MIARRLLLTLLGATLLLGASGCSLFPEPPASLVEAAIKFEAEIRALPGVASANAEVADVDPKDNPGQYYLSVVVTAKNSKDLATVPDLIATVQSPAGLKLRHTLIVPAGEQVAAVTLDNSRNVARAEALRSLPFVTSVRLDDHADRVQVAEGVELTPAVAALRGSGALTAGPFDSVAMAWDATDLDISVSMAGPSAALIDFIDNTWLRLDRVSSSEPGDLQQRPTLSVDASHPEAVSKALAALVGDELDGRPRTAFRVRSDTDEISGYVGFPLGSPEPDDLAAVDPVPPPVDEAARAAQIAADTKTVTRFLVDSAEASGIPGTPNVFVGGCSSAVDSPQVQGTLLLPVFDYLDSAELPYEAVTASWEKSGYAHSEQATGTAIFSPKERRQIAEATIRGTSEGIQITAAAACVA